MILLTLFLEFLKIGAFTFGGGYAMLPLVQEVVLQQGWITEQQIVDFIAVSESTPGPFAVNISTYIGMRTGGFGGAFMATLGVVLPSFVIILIISKFYAKFCNSSVIKGCMMGLRPAVVAMIAASVISVGISVIQPADLDYVRMAKTGFIILAAGIMTYKKLHPIIVITVSGVLGVLASLLPI